MRGGRAYLKSQHGKEKFHAPKRGSKLKTCVGTMETFPGGEDKKVRLQKREGARRCLPKGKLVPLKENQSGGADLREKRKTRGKNARTEEKKARQSGGTRAPM